MLLAKICLLNFGEAYHFNTLNANKTLKKDSLKLAA